MGISLVLLLISLAISCVSSLDKIRNESFICKPEGNILDLSSQKLETIPACEDLDVLDGKMTTKLDLGNNNIIVFDYALIINKFPNISSIYLSNNKIKSLISSDEIITTKVKILDLGWNMIEDVEDGALNNFKQLQQLYLNQNRIKNLPIDVFLELGQLTMIDLTNNKLPILKYNWFSRLKYLEELKLSNNAIEILQPESFKWQTSLCMLDVSRNLIVKIPPLLRCEVKVDECLILLTTQPIVSVEMRSSEAHVKCILSVVIENLILSGLSPVTPNFPHANLSS